MLRSTLLLIALSSSSSSSSSSRRHGATVVSRVASGATTDEKCVLIDANEESVCTHTHTRARCARVRASARQRSVAAAAAAGTAGAWRYATCAHAHACRHDAHSVTPVAPVGHTDVHACVTSSYLFGTFHVRSVHKYLAVANSVYIRAYLARIRNGEFILFSEREPREIHAAARRSSNHRLVDFHACASNDFSLRPLCMARRVLLGFRLLNAMMSR